MTALVVRTGDGTQRRLDPALALYLWSTKGIEAATRDSLDELHAIRPDAVCLHGRSGDLLAALRRCAASVRLSLDGKTRVWVGLGIDGGIDAYRKGNRSAESIVERFASVAALCESIGAEVLVLNGEGQWALESGDVRSRADLRKLASAIGRECKRVAPSVVLGLSSFGRLGYHASVRQLIEGLTPHCSLFTGQSYAAAPGVPRKGALPAILAADEKSQEATERDGWMRPDEVEEIDSADDLDRIPSVQLHKTAPADLCKALAERPHILAWSLPTITEGGRADAEGVECARAARAIRAEVGAGPGAVARYQRAHGLEPDGVPGPITRGTAGQSF